MASSVNERELVLDTLLMITRDGEYSHIVLKNVLDQYQYLEKKERAFITRVVNGTLERMIEIDAVINQFSKVKVNKMKPVIRTILRLSVYQMLYMDSVPDSAVCNEAVKLAQKRGFVNLKGFVNGVLRNIGRNKDKIQYPDEKDTLAWLSMRYSLPEWILKEWLAVYDRETVERMAAEFLEEKPLTVRYNEKKISREDFLRRLEAEGVNVQEDPQVSCAMYLSGYDHLSALPSFREGLFQVQDLSSMQVALWADPRKDDYVIDVCAAPGGKALHIAELLDGTGHVEARDLSEYKTGLIRDNILRSGLANIEAVCRDATVNDADAKGKADIVIADLPCSGLGVLGKKPDLKYKMTEQIQKDLEKLQRRILSVVQTYVKPGGKLLYSTCTINRGENEENACWFQETFPEFRLVREKQMLPGNDAGDGFYIAMFQRKNHE
ncbi:MAG: 16S rRNA (cytosine(967)-C(5))-methyltransferase RsmB [Dorea sp.]